VTAPGPTGSADPAPDLGAPPALDPGDFPAERLSYRHVDFTVLPELEAESLLGRLGAVMQVTASPEVPLGAGWAASRWAERRALLRTMRGYVAEADGSVVGFQLYRGYRAAGRHCLQLVAGYVLPEYQGRGVAHVMNARILFREVAIHPARPFYLVAAMVNPIGLHAWRRRLVCPAAFYPPIPGSSAPHARLRAAAAAIVAEQFPGKVFDAEQGILQAVTPARGTPIPCSGVPEIDGFFEGEVDPLRGDAVLMVCDGSRWMLIRSAAEFLRAIPRARRARSSRGNRTAMPTRGAER